MVQFSPFCDYALLLAELRILVKALENEYNPRSQYVTFLKILNVAVSLAILCKILYLQSFFIWIYYWKVLREILQ